jgi:hypothetical protein
MSTRPEMTVGNHMITATATDAFGEMATDQIRIGTVNTPPKPQIVRPLPGDTLFSHIPIQFAASVVDDDDHGRGHHLSSSRDGPLNIGRQFTRTLTTGTHNYTHRSGRQRAGSFA